MGPSPTSGTTVDAWLPTVRGLNQDRRKGTKARRRGRKEVALGAGQGARLPDAGRRAG